MECYSFSWNDFDTTRFEILSYNIWLKINVFVGSTPLASYRIVSIEPARSIASYTAGNVRNLIWIFSFNFTLLFLGYWYDIKKKLEKWKFCISFRTLWWSWWSTSFRSKSRSIWNRSNLCQILFNRSKSSCCSICR